MMKTLLLRNWNVIRVLRLAIGVWAIVSAFQTNEVLLGVAGGLLLGMAVLNIGCCGVNGCGLPREKMKDQLL